MNNATLTYRGKTHIIAPEYGSDSTYTIDFRELGRKGGKVKSATKTLSSQANGKRGGRPKAK